MKGATSACCAVLLVASGCGSKEEKPAESNATPAPTERAATPTPAAPLAKGDLRWDEPPALAETDPVDISDPDAVVARFETECPDGGTTPACMALRSAVEEIFLHDLIELRAADQTIDREWYRVAARAELPSLACIGARDLVYAMDRMPEDDAALAVALDSPARSVREIALRGAGPEIQAMYPRFVHRDMPTFPLCMENDRDPKADIKWAGGYPGARYRYLASDGDTRWFTTTDPVDEVLAYFAKLGRPGQTKEEMHLEASTKYQEEQMRIMNEAKEGEDDETMKKLVAVGSSFYDWSQPFQNIQGAGPIKYVKIANNYSIAIFEDDLLDATSIVATNPPGR